MNKSWPITFTLAALTFYHGMSGISVLLADPLKVARTEDADDSETKTKSKAVKTESELEYPYNLGLGYGTTNISNAISISDVIQGLAGKGPYLDATFAFNDSNELGLQVGQFENENLLSSTKAIALLLQGKHYWSPTFYQTLAFDYVAADSNLQLPTDPQASVQTTRVVMHIGFGNRIQLGRFTLDLEYLAIGYNMSLLNQKYRIQDPNVERIYKLDEEDAKGNLFLYRTLNLALGYNF